MRQFLKSYSLLIFFSLLSVFIFFVCLYSHSLVNYFMNSNEVNITRRLEETSLRLADLVSGEELAQFRTAEDMLKPDYMVLKQILWEFAEKAHVKHACYIRVEDGLKQYIICNDRDEESQVDLTTPPRPMNGEPILAEAYRNSDEVTVSRLGEYVPGRETLITAYAPIHFYNGFLAAFAGITIDDEDIVASRTMVNRLLIFEMMAILAIFISGILIFFRYKKEAQEAKATTLAKTRFLSNMSHEIRTPMNAIIGLGELIKKNYGSETGFEHLELMDRAGKNLLSIINDILDFSKIESGNFQIINNPYDLASLINDVCMITRLKLEEKDIEFILDISPTLPAVLIGDATRVRQILLNLLSNASKYTEKGHIKFTVSGRPEGPEQVWLTFKVSDTGIGIRQKDLERLFSDFCRIDDNLAAGIEGTGLGLSITRRLCQAMGGDIMATSKFRQGSAFVATIPQKIEKGASTIGSAKFNQIMLGDSKEITFTVPNFWVLSVDDNEMNLIVAEGLLQPYEMKVTSCLSGREAIKKIKEQIYDLVLMDHMMPEMDGIQTVAAIRALGGRFTSLPIIAVTANAMTGMEDMFLKSGFDDFLSKPLEINSFHRMIEKWAPLEKRRPKPPANG